VEKWRRRSKRRKLNFRKGTVRTRSSRVRSVAGDGQMRERARSFGVFTLLRIPLTTVLLLFGLYAWAFLVTAETSRRIYRRIKGT
jgi:hypothetical protein